MAARQASSFGSTSINGTPSLAMELAVASARLSFAGQTPTSFYGKTPTSTGSEETLGAKSTMGENSALNDTAPKEAVEEKSALDNCPLPGPTQASSFGSTSINGTPSLAFELAVASARLSFSGQTPTIAAPVQTLEEKSVPEPEEKPTLDEKSAPEEQPTPVTAAPEEAHGEKSTLDSRFPQASSFESTSVNGGPTLAMELARTSARMSFSGQTPTLEEPSEEATEEAEEAAPSPPPSPPTAESMAGAALYDSQGNRVNPPNPTVCIWPVCKCVCSQIVRI